MLCPLRVFNVSFPFGKTLLLPSLARTLIINYKLAKTMKNNFFLKTVPRPVRVPRSRSPILVPRFS